MTERSQRTDAKTSRPVTLVRASARRAPRLPNTGADDRARELMSMAAHDLRSPLATIIVRRAVERLDGRLKIRNAPGRGVAFDIELPGLQT